MRIVFDTAILARAHPRASGPAKALFDLSIDRDYHIIITEDILAELDRAMRYPRMVKHTKLTPDEITRHVRLVQRIGQKLAAFHAAPLPPISDPNDIHVVQAAICADPDYLCTLDKHFYEQPVVAFCADRGVTVISDIDLLQKLRQCA